MMDSQLAVILVYGAIAFGLGAWNGFNSGERNGRIDVDRAKWIAADKVAQLQADLKASRADCKRAEGERDALKEAMGRNIAQVCRRCNGTGYESGNVDGGYYCDACKGKGY